MEIVAFNHHFLRIVMWGWSTLRKRWFHIRITCLFCTIQVNSNGILSISEPFTDPNSIPFPLSTGDILIAPFWDNIDVTQGGQILYRLTDDVAIRNTVGAMVNDGLGDDFFPSSVFIATWDRVAESGGPSDVN